MNIMQIWDEEAKKYIPIPAIQGPPGEDGIPGADGKSINWRGEYSETAQYSRLDAVSYEGSSYIFASDTPATGAVPGIDDEWAILAEKGGSGTAMDITADSIKTALGYTPADSAKYLPLTGGTLSGNLTGKYLIGTWLQTTAATRLGSTPTKFPVLDASGWIYYRTAEDLKTDLGIPSLSGYATQSWVTAQIQSAIDATWEASY